MATTIAAGLGGLIVARVLGPKRLRGEYAAITASLGIACTVGQMGLPVALCFFVAKDPERARDYFWDVTHNDAHYWSAGAPDGAAACSAAGPRKLGAGPWLPYCIRRLHCDFRWNGLYISASGTQSASVEHRARRATRSESFRSYLFVVCEATST